MADKMWDILNFLKTPSGDNSKDQNIKNAHIKLKEINAQIEDAIENPEQEEVRAPREKLMPEGTPTPVRETSAPRNIEIEKPVPQKIQEEPQTKTLVENETETFDRQSDNSPPSGRLIEIPVASVKPNPYQPRKELGEQEIMELSESIREFGVLQPILVKRIEDGYELIAGERRLRAATRAGLSQIPAVLFEAAPLNQQIMALVENIQRKNLSSIEEAASLQDILGKTGWSQSELSRRMGRSQASIANKLRLLRLDPEVQGFVISGNLGERQARSLLSLLPEDQRILAQKAVDEDLSSRALEALVENWSNKPAAPRARSTRANDTPGGELLGDVATLINRYRNRGIAAQWKVKQMNQSSLVVEITVDLLKGSVEEETTE